MRLLLLLATLCVAVAAAPAGACACGIALDASVTRERALVIEHDGREEIIASFDLQADGPEAAAVVLPVPGDPEVEAVTGGDPLAFLDQATLPRAPASGGGSDEGAVGAAPPVDVIGRETVGGYDVTRLRANDAGALDDWLDDNGYALPEGAEPILDDYVEEGWRYVAIKLAPDTDGRLEPLRVSFDTEETVYPMRLTQLGTEPVELTLYVTADGERRADGLDVAFEGDTEDLGAPPELQELIEAQPRLTKLTAAGADPSSFDHDIDIESAGPSAAVWAPLLAVLAAITAVVWSRRSG